MLRVRPRPWIGVVTAVGYLVLVVALQRVSGVPYPALGDSGSTLFRGAGVSLIVGAVLLAILTTALGWWRPALRERHPSPTRWALIAPAVLGLVVLTNLAGVDWPAYGWGFLGASVALLLVGFTEELTIRGLLLTGLRARLPEPWVWLLSTVAFGAMHLVNVLAGLPVAAAGLQAGNAFLFGTALYVLRRVSGSLVWCMVLHGLWDVSLFALGRGRPAPWADLADLLEIPAGLLALVAVAWVARGVDERTA